MNRTRKALFGLTMLAGLAAAVGALAQPAPNPPAPPPGTNAAAQASGDAAASADVVVTGSRIKRVTVYNSPSPVKVITSDRAQLTGLADTTALLQLSTVANNAIQINNSFGAFENFGGAGINSLSLRGLGVQRTLILLDGQRLGPAGVGGTVDPVDLNTIPASMIDHVEILNDGASSIYGSDAVAGVVNIITKKKLNGGELEIYGNPSEHGGGDIFQASGDYGKTFDRGYVSGGFDVYRQNSLDFGQRKYLECARDIAVDATTHAPADLIDPLTGKAKCNNEFLLSGGVEDGFTGNVFAPVPGAPGGPGVPPGFVQVGQTFPGNPAATRASQAAVPFTSPQFDDATAIAPVTRYTVNLAAGFDITPHNQVYGTFLFNQRNSSQLSVSQFFVQFLNPGNPFITDPAFGAPVPVLPQFSPTTQQVNYSRAVLGFKGDLPALGWWTNWTYDIYGQAALSDGSYTEHFARNDRVNATAGAGAGTNGCDVNALAFFGGTGETMAQAEPGVACVPVDYISAAQRGAFTPAEEAFLYVTEKGHTTYNHDYIDGSVTGDLFKLPAGPLSGAFGFQVRNESLKDTPPADFINQNAFHLTTVGVTQGSESSEELYGELQIPVLRDLPFIKHFDVNISGRFSNYSSFGSNETYKIGLNWRVTDWLTFRATQGSAFRAPALFEQFLANQTGFEPQLGLDPCIKYGTSGASVTVRNNCASLGIPPNFTGGQDAATVFQGGGKSLKPETSIAQTVGVVFQPTWRGLDLKVAATYFAFDIRNQIQQFGASNIVFQCMSSTNFPNSPFCSLFTRNNNPADTGDFHGIETVNDDFVNVARQIEQGIDLDVTYVTPTLPYDSTLTIEGQASWSLYTNTILLGGQTNNFLGSIGQPSFVGNLNFKLDKGPWTLNAFINMVGPQSDADFVASIDPNFDGTGQAVFLEHRTGFYATADIALRRKFDTFTITGGIKNLFDTAPPAIGAEDNSNFGRIGVTPLVSQYDLIGRTFFLGLTKTFN